jgi:hypothetical protein
VTQPDKFQPWLTEAEALAVQPLTTLTDYLAKIRSVQRPTSRTTLLSLRTEEATPLELWVEPWGNHIFLDPKVDYAVVAYNHAPQDTQPDLLLECNHGSVLLWSNTRESILKIFREEQEVVY